MKHPVPIATPTTHGAAPEAPPSSPAPSSSAPSPSAPSPLGSPGPAPCSPLRPSLAADGRSLNVSIPARVARSGVDRPAELLALSYDGALVRGIDGLFAGLTVDLAFSLPMSGRACRLAATVVGEPDGEAPPGAVRLRLLDPPAELRQELARLRIRARRAGLRSRDPGQPYEIQPPANDPAPTPDVPDPRWAAERTGPREILIVDPHGETRDLVSSVLRTRGYRAVTATSAREGLARAFERRPDLICLDSRLRDVELREVCLALRGDPRTRDLPILVLTSRPASEQRTEVEWAGTADVLSRPLDVRELVRRVRRLAGEPGPASASGPPPGR